ncbi:hypothetical protein ONZ45_g599 [Pleurotus djamor]|nr:hypothetical protein ONZ45_g599 [Pleurotus djamor]
MSTQLSSNNPFRSNAQTPANTGSLDPASHSQPPPITATEAQRPNNAGNPAAPNDPASNHANPPPVQTRVESATPPPPLAADDFGLDTELPPAYTPSADARQGESTLEYGPSRPFQQAPHQQIRPPQQQFLTPQPTGQSTSSWSSGNGAQSNYRSRSRGPLGLLTQFADELERQLTVTAREMSRPTTYRQVSPAIVVPARTGGGGWSAYPGQRPPQPYPNNAAVPRHSTGTPLPPPPPSHPQHARSVSSPQSPHLDVPSPTRAPTSDFARDFYASGSDSASLTDGMANMNIDSASRSAPNLPSSPPAQTSYGPPPGPPPGCLCPTTRSPAWREVRVRSSRTTTQPPSCPPTTASYYVSKPWCVSECGAL